MSSFLAASPIQGKKIPREEEQKGGGAENFKFLFNLGCSSSKDPQPPPNKSQPEKKGFKKKDLVVFIAPIWHHC